MPNRETTLFLKFAGNCKSLSTTLSLPLRSTGRLPLLSITSLLSLTLAAAFAPELLIFSAISFRVSVPFNVTLTPSTTCAFSSPSQDKGVLLNQPVELILLLGVITLLYNMDSIDLKVASPLRTAGPEPLSICACPALPYLLIASTSLLY